eukprot:6783388-Pyramimonas_sp.AAC.1
MPKVQSRLCGRGWVAGGSGRGSWGNPLSSLARSRFRTNVQKCANACGMKERGRQGPQTPDGA